MQQLESNISNVEDTLIDQQESLQQQFGELKTQNLVEVIQSIKDYNTGIEQAHAQMVKDEINKMQFRVLEKVDKLDRSIVLIQRDLVQTKMDQQTPIA